MTIYLLVEFPFDQELEFTPAVMLMLRKAPRLRGPQRLQHIDIVRTEHLGPWKSHDDVSLFSGRLDQPVSSHGQARSSIAMAVM